VLQQQRDHVHVAVLRRAEQRRPPVLAFAVVHRRALPQQQLAQRHVPHGGGARQRGLAAVGEHVGARAVGEQQGRDGVVTEHGRPVQRRTAFVVLGVHVRATLQEQGDDGFLVASDGEVQRRGAALVQVARGDGAAEAPRHLLK